MPKCNRARCVINRHVDPSRLGITVHGTKDAVPEMPATVSRFGRKRSVPSGSCSGVVVMTMLPRLENAGGFGQQPDGQNQEQGTNSAGKPELAPSPLTTLHFSKQYAW